MKTVTVHVIHKGKVHIFEYGGDYPLLTLLRQKNIDPPFSCLSAKCGFCKARLLEGSVEMKKTEALSVEEKNESKILTCQSIPLSDVIKIEFE